MYNHYKTILVL